jgi:hypothetical protein
MSANWTRKVDRSKSMTPRQNLLPKASSFCVRSHRPIRRRATRYGVLTPGAHLLPPSGDRRAKLDRLDLMAPGAGAAQHLFGAVSVPDANLGIIARDSAPFEPATQEMPINLAVALPAPARPVRRGAAWAQRPLRRGVDRPPDRRACGTTCCSPSAPTWWPGSGCPRPSGSGAGTTGWPGSRGSGRPLPGMMPGWSSSCSRCWSPRTTSGCCTTRSPKLRQRSSGTRCRPRPGSQGRPKHPLQQPGGHVRFLRPEAPRARRAAERGRSANGGAGCIGAGECCWR